MSNPKRVLPKEVWDELVAQGFNETEVDLIDGIIEAFGYKVVKR